MSPRLLRLRCTLPTGSGAHAHPFTVPAVRALADLRDAVDDGSQFVPATHSPLLLADPGARLYSFDDAPPAAVEWDALEHVRLTRDFLQRTASDRITKDYDG